MSDGPATTTIYIGNFPFETTEEDLRNLCSPIGTVYAVKILTDRITGVSRGFGFVTMDPAAADQAISLLNNTLFAQRRIRVNYARSRPGSG